MVGFENYQAKGSRFVRGGPQIFFSNRQISSETPEIFSKLSLDPNAPLGQKSPKIPEQQEPKQGFSFRKCDERG